MNTSVGEILRRAGLEPVCPDLSRHGAGESGQLQARQGTVSRHVPTVPTQKYKGANATPLEQCAAGACEGLDNVTTADVLGGLAPEDIADFEPRSFPPKALRAFALALSATRWRQDGIAPPWWNSPARCDRCGDVYLWAPLHVAGCPWCWNRLHGVKIPRPPIHVEPRE